ncbi:hypothetical protein, partial [Micromonospora wenchangensis]|uniref:hypothetical protein n=1 Tax=Micromonospora wenchangensis TaxID=1185415 RepID=UPI00343D2120
MTASPRPGRRGHGRRLGSAAAGSGRRAPARAGRSVGLGGMNTADAYQPGQEVWLVPTLMTAP